MPSPTIDTLLIDLATFTSAIAAGDYANRPDALAATAHALAERTHGLDLGLIEPVLTLSTAHLTEADDEAIRNGFCPPTCFISQAGEGGYTLVVLDDEIQPANPTPEPGLETVIEKARALGCSRIRFDSCGSTLDGLPVHSW